MKRPNGRRHQAANATAPRATQHPEHKVEDVFVRHTDKDGRTHVEEHRVWNRELFLKSLARGAVQAGGEAKAEAITREQFDQERDKHVRRGKRR